MAFTKGHKPFFSWKGKKRSKEDRLKMSLAHKGKKKPWIALANKLRPKELTPMYGKRHSMETKMKISKTKKADTNIRGRNAWQWKGGISLQGREERVKFRHEMQKAVFERDNYTCQHCQQKGGDLQVDHIQSWADYIELRFSMDNCRTLCMSCHYEITFGKPKPKNIVWGHNFMKGGY